MTVFPSLSGHDCVLIVDDDKDVRETFRDVVEMRGCSAILAASGREGLRDPCYPTTVPGHPRLDHAKDDGNGNA